MYSKAPKSVSAKLLYNVVIRLLIRLCDFYFCTRLLTVQSKLQYESISIAKFGMEHLHHRDLILAVVIIMSLINQFNAIHNTDMTSVPTGIQR